MRSAPGSSGWTELGESAFPGTSFFRSTWGTAAPRSGSYAYALSNHAYGYLQSDPIPISPNTDYDLHAYVRGGLDPDDSARNWLIRAIFYDSSNGKISQQDADYGSAGTLTSTWQQQGGTVTTPTGAATMRIILYNYMNSGWAAYDDVSLEGESVRVTKHYFHGGQRVALRRNGVLYYVVADHLESTSIVLDAGGTVHSEVRHYPYGEERWRSGTLPTDYHFTGQLLDGYVGLYQMGARWYDPYVNRFLSPDSIIPQPGDPQNFNRFSYTLGNPLKYRDPSGHQAEIPELMRQAIEYFKNLGWRVVGDPSLLHENMNGADLVFTTGSGNSLRVLAVELKDVTGNVTLSTLKRSSEFGDYGGSIDRLVRRASDLTRSSNKQMRLMAETILKGNKLGTLENALFRSAKGIRNDAEGISRGAKDLFDGVYRMLQDGKVKAIKDEIDKPSLWARAGATASAGWSSVRAWGTQLVTDLSNTTTSLPIFYLPCGALDPMQDAWAPWYSEPVMN